MSDSEDFDNFIYDDGKDDNDSGDDSSDGADSRTVTKSKQKASSKKKESSAATKPTKTSTSKVSRSKPKQYNVDDDDDDDATNDDDYDGESDGAFGGKPAKKPAASRKAAAKKSTAMVVDDDEDRGDEMGGSSSSTNRGVLKPISASTTSKTADGKTIEEIYQKKTQLEHILLRPDTYIGSVESQTLPMWVYDGGNRMSYRNVTWVPGLYKIFDEILVNAADNKIRDKSMDTVKVTIDKENNIISVYNNGKGIPIEMHAKEKMYVPELIFGNLLTSSNYDDSERKVTGGRNGYGAKLCNIFSTEFIVETGDSAKGLKYKQVFSKNMSKTNLPKITNAKTEDFTRITFKPDLSKFGMTHLDDDTTALLRKRAYDLAGVVAGVKVFLNDTRLKIRSFKDYIDMYGPPEEGESSEVGAMPKPTVVHERVNDRWEIAVTVSPDGSFHQISFVNSINTSKGGTHVSHVVDPLVSSLMEMAKKKDKRGGAALKPNVVKGQLSVFVNCLIENPTFDSQTKENMTLKAAKFGSKCPISEEFVKKVAKAGVLENVMAMAKFKSDQAMKKTDGHKSSRISGIPKLDDANNAGTRTGADCVLILTEGDSAKSLAVSGLSVIGRSNFGVFPLRGKLLNVREASGPQVAGNAEITALKRILGLQQGKTYTSVKDLRYGHIMIMTDQDHDGSHIKGLIINFLDHFWPSLLKIPGFLLEFITPIVTPKNKSSRQQAINFFTIPEYERWKSENDDGKGWTIKYYKGLGTSTSDDAKQYFSNMQLHRKPFRAASEDDRALVDMAFNKKKADDRKEWLRQLQFGTFMDHSVREIKISDFINKELILFSQADNLRSIPSSVDGFKPGHRKIIYSCFKRNLKSEIKVTQLAGYVSEHSAYHHGEASLFATIIGLAQNFVGSNNINLLMPQGQFGTRLQGGKDAASSRYIFTMLNPIARTIFHPEDDVLLKYLNDDGQDIEPTWYIPILPMILVNGADGIGTGWSTSIPNYNPRDIVENLQRLMRDESPIRMHPWYRGYKGTIIPTEKKDQYRVTGTIRKISDTEVQITELPIHLWTQTYKEMLESWMTGDEAKKQPAWIKDFKEYHSDSHVDFIVTLTEENMKQAEEEGLEKKFKLTTTLSTSNLVCFDIEGRIAKYESPEDLVKDFYNLRLKYYMLRKEAMLNRLTNDWSRLENRVRFITEIIAGKLRVQNRKKAELLKELKEKGYVPFPKGKDEKGKAAAAAANENDDDESEDGDDVVVAGSYDYLLSMPIWSLTLERVDQLKKERDEKQAEISWLTEQTPKDLWGTDLDTFLAQLEAYENRLEEQETNAVKKAKSPLKGGKGKKAVAPKKKVVKKQESSDEEDDDVLEEFSDHEDDFVKSAPKPKPKASKPVVSMDVAAKKSTLTSSADLLSLKSMELPKPSSKSVTEARPPAPAKPKPKPKAAVKEPVILESSEDDKDDEFKFDETPPRKKVALSPFASKIATTATTVEGEPAKKRLLGGKKAVLPGKAQPITNFFTKSDTAAAAPTATAATITVAPPRKASVVDLSSDVEDVAEEEENDRPVAVAAKPAKKPSATATKAAKPSSSKKKAQAKVTSPVKRSRKAVDSESEDEFGGDGGASGSDGEEEEVVESRRGASRRAAATKPVKYTVVLSDEDMEEAEESFVQEDEEDDDF